MFRRRTDTATDEIPEAPEAAKPEGKGRPTPKRRDAEKRNRRPITAPRTRKEAYRQTRERQARERQQARVGMARGDDRYLPKRDQGPARRFARDFVDSRRTFGEYFMIVTLLILIVALFAPLAVKSYLYAFGWPILLVLIVGESIYLGTRVRRLAQERFPGENIRGIGMYAATRSMQIRRFRMPPPRRKPGQKDEL